MPVEKRVGSRAVFAIAVAVLVIGGWLLMTSEDSRPPAPKLATDQTAVSSPQHPAPASGSAQRRPVLHDITWTIVDDRGQAVARANSTVGTAQLTSDSHGRTSTSTEAAQLSVVAAAPLHTTVEATVTPQGSNVITLQRVLPLTVRALDAADGPVADVEICIARRGFNSPSRAADTGSRVARTGIDGLAVLADVAPGTWLLDARHDDLVYSREGQAGGRGGYEGAVVFMPHEQVVTIRMAEPYVIAVETDAGDILSCGIRSRGSGMHQPSNLLGQTELQARQARVQAAHPKASVFVNLPNYPAVDPQSIEVQATVWVAGRRPWQGELRPVRLRDFRAPTRIALTDMPESDEFGSVMVHLASASGRELTDVRMQLLPADMQSPLFLTGQTPFNCEKAVQGQLITLPVGNWRLTLTNPFLQRRADDSGPIQIDRGSFREVRLGHECDWARCRLGSNDDAPHAAGTFTITHLDSGIAVAQLVNDIQEGIEMWLPAGRIRLEITARQLGLAPEDVRTLSGKVEGMVEASTAGVQRLSARVASRP